MRNVVFFAPGEIEGVVVFAPGIYILRIGNGLVEVRV
jgi:hypothetical protein